MTSLPPTRLCWRVRAMKDGETGEWSSWAYFTPKMLSPIRIGNLAYSGLFAYLAVLVFSILLFFIYSLLNKEILSKFNIIFSIAFIIIYPLSIFWTRFFRAFLIRHAYSSITFSIIIILYVLINLFRNENKFPFKMKLAKINIRKIHVLYFVMFAFTAMVILRNVQSNCLFISDKWRHKNQIFGGYEKTNLFNLIEWIKKNTGKNDLIAFQFDDIGEIHILSGRPLVILPRHSSYELLIKFLKYYRPHYVILHNEHLNKTPLIFNKMIEEVCMELGYSPSDIIDRHKIWSIRQDLPKSLAPQK